MKKFLIVCGPTATGKTKLGINLAKKFNGEIISADSRQVYQGMTIGTGKDFRFNSKFKSQNAILRQAQYCPEYNRRTKLKVKMQNFEIGYYEIDKIKIWLLDVVKPDYRFNVADYKKCSDIVLEDILKRGKLPIVVGGTGFYIKAITEGIETMGVEPDWELREQLLNCSIVKLFEILEKIDPERSRGMNESDRQNPRRLIRAIEIARNSPPSPRLWRTSKFDTFFIGLMASYKTLYKRIDQRVDERVEAGVEDEIKGLLKNGYNWDNSALGTTLAYSEWREYFAKNKTKEEIIQKWKYDEHNYARRQMTWFRKNKQINWFDIMKDNWQKEVEKRIENWYTIK